jgi:hypothetical protein
MLQIMIYLYLGIGFLVFFSIFRQSDMAKLSMRELVKTIRQKATGHDALLEFWAGLFLFPLFIAGVMVVWPYALYNQYDAKRKADAREQAEKLSISRPNLIKHLSMEEIEILERVDDPCSAVPSLPFGHLNAAWEKFKCNIQEGDEVWSFSAIWNHSWGKQECQGYALLRGNEVMHHYLTGLVYMKNPEPTLEEIEARLTDKDEFVRASVAKNRKIIISEDQMGRGLQDSSPWVRDAFTKRYYSKVYARNRPSWRLRSPSVTKG